MNSKLQLGLISRLVNAALNGAITVYIVFVLVTSGIDVDEAEASPKRMVYSTIPWDCKCCLVST